jgi:hypothetical protein
LTIAVIERRERVRIVARRVDQLSLVDERPPIVLHRWHPISIRHVRHSRSIVDAS